MNSSWGWVWLSLLSSTGILIAPADVHPKRREDNHDQDEAEPDAEATPEEEVGTKESLPTLSIISCVKRTGGQVT